MTFQLTSTAFKNGGIIPDKFTCYGADISPALAWSDPPANTQSFVLIVEDPEVPNRPLHHWLTWNLGVDKRELPEGIAKAPLLSDGSRQGQNDFEGFGYGGPSVRQGASHDYVFTLYALDSRPDVPPGSKYGALTQAMQGHVLAQAQLVGTFRLERRRARMLALEEDKEFVL